MSYAQTFQALFRSLTYKPRIRKHLGVWICESEDSHLGCGFTPRMAYEVWAVLRPWEVHSPDAGGGG